MPVSVKDMTQRWMCGVFSLYCIFGIEKAILDVCLLIYSSFCTKGHEVDSMACWCWLAVLNQIFSVQLCLFGADKSTLPKEQLHGQG
jgi:hypothetical protein